MDNYNMLQPLAIGCGWFIVRNNKFANPFLELKYTYHMRKKKFSFQEYILFIMVEEQQVYIDNDRYKVTVYIKPCDNKIYCLECAFCSGIEDIIEKVKCFAHQYQSPNNWSIEQIRWIYPIWEAKRNAQNLKTMIEYHGTQCPSKPFDYIPLKIPEGWTIVLNSFVKNDSYLFFSQTSNQKDEFSRVKIFKKLLTNYQKNPCTLYEMFEWERDIAAFCLECPNYEIVVELQEYVCKNPTATLLHIHVYYNRKDGVAFFEPLENIFCFSMEETQEQLSQFLWKYRNGLLDIIVKAEIE